MASVNARGVSRVLQKIDNSIKNGEFYEAHQMYRMLYFRYLGQEKYLELLDMLYNGAMSFLDHNQDISGADLGTLLVDVLVQSGNKDYTSWTPKLCKIFAKINPITPERDTFIIKTIRWSSLDGKFGHPFLHQSIAQVYWNEKNYIQARHHYLHSKDGQGCARLLIEFQRTQGFRCEADLFIAQVVLQYLCLSNKSTANQTFASYTQQHPSIKKNGPPYLLPLLNFLWFLLQAIESRKMTSFTVLCQQYEPSIKRDPCYVQYLDKIGQIFFGLKPPPQTGKAFFDNFIQSFLNAEDDSEDEVTLPSSSRQIIESTDLD
ncbi:Golgi to ER traffic protein 4 homolog [Onthophagus taurus]|uniref:Golgi to ER traffic protein 4 homolog n=1 Tax=Onthophagus taurus TaxID=166361 RepID=UPI000C20ECDC|nr:Golgi to ER traffic protein 4 homolog [Onthophagus taurus]